MAYVKCVECEFVGRKTKSNGDAEPLQNCEKRIPKANQAEGGLALYPIVELSDGGCHEGREQTNTSSGPKPVKSDKK